MFCWVWCRRTALHLQQVGLWLMPLQVWVAVAPWQLQMIAAAFVLAGDGWALPAQFFLFSRLRRHGNQPPEAIILNSYLGPLNDCTRCEAKLLPARKPMFTDRRRSHRMFWFWMAFRLLHPNIWTSWLRADAQVNRWRTKMMMEMMMMTNKTWDDFKEGDDEKNQVFEFVIYKKIK